MKIDQLDLIAFGRFTNQHLDFSHGASDFHMVYGPNESGKTTCLRAICALFFGMPRTLTDDFVHSYKKLRVGATLTNESGSALQMVRRKADKNSLFQGDDQTPVDESVMTGLLGGIDQATFTTRFGLSHEQLVEGGQSIVNSHGELGEILFAAGAGVGRLKEIEADLDSETAALFLPRGKKTLNTRIRELEDKRKELRQFQVPPAEYASLKRELEEAESEARQVADQLAGVQSKLGRLSACRSAKQIVPVWRRDKEQLQSLTDVPVLDPEFAARRREASAKKQAFDSSVQKNREQIRVLKERIQTCPVDIEVLANEQEIVSLFQDIGAREAAAKDQEGLRRKVANYNRHLREHLRDLDVSIETDADQATLDRAVDRLHLSDAMRIRIHELAADYELIRQREHDSAQQLQKLRNQLAELDDLLEQTPAVLPPQTLDSVLGDIGSPDLLLDQREQQHSECEEMLVECDRLRRELGLSEFELEPSVQLSVPHTSDLDVHEENLQTMRRRHADAAAALQRLESACNQARMQLDALNASRELPTEQEIVASRRQRDETVDRLESRRSERAAFEQTTRELRQTIQKADFLVDTTRVHQEQVTRRDAAQRELIQLESDIGAARETVKISQDDLESAERAWRDLWQAIGISPRTVREMRTWLANHQRLVSRYESLVKARTRLQSIDRRINRCCERLVNALRQVKASQPVASSSSGADFSECIVEDSMGLEALHDQALHVRSQLVVATSHREDLERRRDETREAIPEAEAAFKSSSDRRADWEAQWRSAIGAIASDSDTSPSVINSRLGKITNMFQERRERDIVLTRIRSIDHDNEQFQERIGTLAGLLSANPPAAAVEPAADTMADQSDRRHRIPESKEVAVKWALEFHQRLSKARQNKEEREQLLESLAEVQKQLDENEQFLQAERSLLDELCREAGVDATEDLPEIERRAAEKRALIESFHAAEKQLLLIADGQELEAFAAEVEKHESTALQQEIEELERSKAEWDERWQAVQQRVGGLKKECDSIDGSGRAAELNQELQFLAGRIQHEAQQYARLSLGSMLLKRAIEHYRQENQSPVLKLACQAFEQLTCGRYSGLRPEFDEKGRSKLFGVQTSASGDESLVPVDAMSLGTADALYLAMRLASLEHQLSSGRAIPVVIDDCLIQLDDDRAVAALRLFSKLSAATQVILFTHHRHLIDLAQHALAKDEFHLHRLDSEAARQISFF